MMNKKNHKHHTPNIKILSILSVIILISFFFPVSTAAASFTDKINASSAILMEAGGKVLFEQNADQPLPPASVTKVMTLLLCMEAIDSGKIGMQDKVTVSDHAASMGGSQIFLEMGEQMSVEDMIKSVVVASANDAAVALAEHIAGSEGAFVNMMNQRARELGMNNTQFENTNGLDDSTERHVASARDIAIMSAQLLKHEKILDYTSIWQDTIRDGSFTLSNTNRLIRFYEGANGLKTGSTSKAKYCISATAKRDGMQLICVIMGAPTRDIRNAEAKKLLDFGFANYGLYKYSPENMGKVKVKGSNGEELSMISERFEYTSDKSKLSAIEKTVVLPSEFTAPVKSGDKIGSIIFTIDGERIGETDIIASNSVEKITFIEVLLMIIEKFVSIF